MPKNDPRRIIAGVALALVAMAVALHGCREQPTEPERLQASAAAQAARHLELLGEGSTASGTLTSSAGGLSCTITSTDGTVTATGTCVSDFPSGTLVVITAAPAADGGTVTWTGCDHAHTDDPLSCRVMMTTDRSITAAFAPRPTSFVLTVQGGAGGSGSVRSTPAGISCTVNAGTTKSGCSARFPTGSTVTLRATATGGKPIKAWAGGGCEQSGPGVGSAGSSCAVTMSQTQSVVVSFEATANEAVMGSWSAPIAWPHVAIHAHVLPNGLVMTWSRKHTALPVLWNPAAPGVFVTLNEPQDFFCSGHSFLADGRLFVAGGHSGAADFGIKASYLYNPTLNRWSASKKMANGRWYPTNTTLGNGAVLTISGGDTAGVLNRIPEVWKKGTWRALTGAERAVPYYPRMFVAPNGRVFMAGPEQQSMYLNTANAGSWIPGPQSNFGDRNYGTAVMYDVGKILLVGGNEASPTNTAEVINLNVGSGATWRYTAPMAVARRQLNATVLADGTVLVTGGTDMPGFNTAPSDSRVLAAELWDPDTESWTQLSSMSHHRVYHATAVLLTDGRVLSVGSGLPSASGLPDEYTAEIFSPPYLFNGDGTPAVRPSITSAPLSLGYGQAFTVSTPDAGSISRVTWIRLSSVTHSFNQNQRADRLTFSVSSTTSLSVQAPGSRNNAPPGHYMLFIINGSGVPSEAKVIRIS